MSDKKVIDLHSLPPEILAAEQTLTFYFRGKNIKKWALGGVQNREPERLSNFQRVSRLNQCAGNVATLRWDSLERQMKVVASEVEEMKEGIETRDIVEVLDGAVDTLVTAYGMLHLLGVDGDAMFGLVMDALETRLDTSPEHAAMTADHYKSLGIEVFIRHTSFNNRWFYATISATEQEHPKYGKLPQGKWLKSIFREEVELNEHIPIEILEAFSPRQ